MITIEEFRAEAREWLASKVARRETSRREWGRGSDRVPIFHNLTRAEEQQLIDECRAWRRLRYDEGFGALSWTTEHGGRGLLPSHELAYDEEEADFAVPASHESVGITVGLIAPTIRHWGTVDQRDRFLRPMLRTDEMWCQLFSEPGSGSDLAGVQTRANQHGDEWEITGQKVWTSGAQYADWGYLLARTDPYAPKHQGLTAFVVPMRVPNVEVRPLRQMSGGSSFNEVFFDGMRLTDDMRLGPVGEGWSVAVTTLGFERVVGSGEGGKLTERGARAVELAQHLGAHRDPVVRQGLAKVYSFGRLLELNNRRTRESLKAGATPGPEGSFGKLFYSLGLAEVTEVVSRILGPRLTADSGEWGTFAWAEHVTGVPGQRVAGGTDEIQRNIIAERVLGLPREPRMDKGAPSAQRSADSRDGRGTP